MSDRRAHLVVALAAMTMVFGILLFDLTASDFDPNQLLRVGEVAASRNYVEADLGAVPLSGDYGHDGQQFYVIADVFPNLNDAEGHVDSVPYRARRIAYPALLALAPSGTPRVLAMIAINLLAVGAIATAISRYANRLGAPPSIGLAAGITPAFIASAVLTLADSMAVALSVWAALAFEKYPRAAALLLSVAVLTRETTLAVVVAAALMSKGTKRLWFALPVAVYVGWMLAVRAMVDDSVDVASSKFVFPCAGWLRLGLLSRPTVLAASLAIASVWAAARLGRRTPVLSLWLLAHAALLTVANEGIIDHPLNVARLAPMTIPAVLLVIGADWHTTSTVEPKRESVPLKA